MTEEELNNLRQQARAGDAKAECNLAVAYSRDYFKSRAIFTLRALYREVFAMLNTLIEQKCQSGASDRLSDDIEAFRYAPSQSSLNALMAAIILDSNTHDANNSWKVVQDLQEALEQLSVKIPDILDAHFPEWHKLQGLEDSVAAFTETHDTDALMSLIAALNASARIKGDKNLILKLLADSLWKGYQTALEELGKLHGLHAKGMENDGYNVFPVMSAEGNEDFPSIPTGQYYPAITVHGKSLKIPKSIPFFDAYADPLNRFIVVRHDDKSFSTRKASTACTQALLASIMAWAGPHGFTIDVVDYENSGIGATVASYLPMKEIKILTNDEEWDKELDALNGVLAKRTAMFPHFLTYNAAHPDMKEALKIVVVQDFSGDKISLGEAPTKEDDQEKHHNYKMHKKLVERYAHLLKRGFQYGILFIVNTSNREAYTEASYSIDCTTDLTMPQNPFNCLHIEGVESNEEDWLLKHLADGKMPHRRKEETSSAADGIMTTALSEENPDAVFQLDTVSHTHAFVIGKTGSGKSVLLHNFITGLISRYAPDDLMLYLLDMKMGGVEFNRYRSLPHLRSLLVDNSDIQIVLEIMRDIELMMRERGKVFRTAGVSNIKEYNHAHPEAKMPQVIVVIDECHQIFSMGSGSNASKEQRGITERLSKIAKEGRSQGIHLIFATQTLSGSEIPPDIQKNITDYYLLKCAPSDSESLVRGSSNKTEALPVGKVYYYHADKQLLFQGIYRDAKECESIINEAVAHYKNSANHGQFYFNGSQTFSLDENVINGIVNDKTDNLLGAVGRQINLQQDVVRLDLKADYAENVIVTGINNEGQLDRTSMALLFSQLLAAHSMKKELKIKVIDCSPKGAKVSTYLQQLDHEGLISCYRSSESEGLLKELCQQVKQNMIFSPTMLYIFGQDRFGEMKRDLAFSEDTTEKSDEGVIDASALFSSINFTGISEDSKDFNSYKKAVSYLLDNGPTKGLHTLIQLDKSDNLLFEDYVSGKMVSARFKHIVILRCDSREAMQLGLNDDLKPEMLSADPERLRAYYYNDDDGKNILFSPFEQLETKDIANIINPLNN